MRLLLPDCSHCQVHLNLALTHVSRHVVGFSLADK